MSRTAPHFVQITPLGWNRFDALVAWNGTCARLWTRLARSIDTQAVVITTAVALATDLGVSAATVRRHLGYLESVHAFIRFRLPGGLTAFAMNPNEVWSGKSTLRSRAPYCTGTLGGDILGNAALRRGSWFLPGMDPVEVKTSEKKSSKSSLCDKTGNLFESLPKQTAPKLEMKKVKKASDTKSAPTSKPTPQTSHVEIEEESLIESDEENNVSSNDATKSSNDTPPSINFDPLKKDRQMKNTHLIRPLTEISSASDMPLPSWMEGLYVRVDKTQEEDVEV